MRVECIYSASWYVSFRSSVCKCWMVGGAKGLRTTKRIILQHGWGHCDYPGGYDTERSYIINIFYPPGGGGGGVRWY